MSRTWSLATITSIEQLTLLHLDHDHDFGLIPDVTGQATEWVVPHGAVG